MTDEEQRPTAMAELTRDLVDALDRFVRARLDEMEQRAHAVQALLAGFDRPLASEHASLSAAGELLAHHLPEHDLCDVASTRRLLDHLMTWIELFLPLAGREAQALILLASRWRLHPDWAALLTAHAKPLPDAQAPS